MSFFAPSKASKIYICLYFIVLEFPVFLILNPVKHLGYSFFVTIFVKKFHHRCLVRVLNTYLRAITKYYKITRQGQGRIRSSATPIFTPSFNFCNIG